MWPFSRWHKRAKAAEEHVARAQKAYVQTLSEDQRINALASEARLSHAKLRREDERNHFTDTLYGFMGRQH